MQFESWKAIDSKEHIPKQKVFNKSFFGTPLYKTLINNIYLVTIANRTDGNKNKVISRQISALIKYIFPFSRK